MSRDKRKGGRSLEDVRADLAGRLRARRGEIDHAILTGIRTVPDAVQSGDAEYVAGQQQAVAALVDYGLAGIEQGELWSGPIPSVAVEQAHRAARAGVRQETLLRRYFAGHTLLEDFVMQEAENASLLGQAAALRLIRRTQAALLDRVVSSIADEHAQEVKRARSSPGQRRAARVRRLLAGEASDMAGLDYELDGWHLGIIARGAGAERAVRGIAAKLGHGLLCVPHGERTVWAWLGGGRRRATATDIERLHSNTWPAGLLLAVGEPGKGVEGWCLTHRQAQAALLVALRQPQAITKYVDVALLAAALQDDLLASSLAEIYLSPLPTQASKGAEWRETLRAYFETAQNFSRAARKLDTTRQTVESRLNTIETTLGRPRQTWLADLAIALHLEELIDPMNAPLISEDTLRSNED